MNGSEEEDTDGEAIDPSAGLKGDSLALFRAIEAAASKREGKFTKKISKEVKKVDVRVGQMDSRVQSLQAQVDAHDLAIRRLQTGPRAGTGGASAAGSDSGSAADGGGGGGGQGSSYHNTSGQNLTEPRS